MSGVVKFVVVNAFTIAFTGVMYIALTNAMVLYWSTVYLGYDVVNGANDAEAIIVIALLWDRLFGPFSHMIRKCSKLKSSNSSDDYV